ncbi:MAG: alpha/beta hydrolase, partial [Proteobacteria bacterium]|nr:alpha/beta hydrolase [Pseudomonadota bacterium]
MMVKNYLLFLTFMAYFYPYSSIRADDSPKVQTLPLQRESELAKLDQTFMQAWFDGEKDQWIRGTDSADGKVMLRYRAFVRAEHTANIILVHGYGERIEKFAEIAYDFHQAGYSVFLLDQRGFGLSGWLNPEGSKAIYVERFENYARDVEQFIEGIVKPQSSSRPVYIFAHS